jgi:ribosomal protein L7/L12
LVTEQQFSDLRKRVAHLEGQVAFLYEHLGMTFVPEPQLEDDPKIIEALKGGNLLLAMKVYRENTGATMDDAKKAVEQIQGRLGI